MDKKRILQGCVLVFTIIISTSSIIFSYNKKKYNYELTTQNILPTIEESRATYLVAEYIEERIEKDIIIDLAQEKKDMEEENLEKIVEESNEDIVTSSIEENIPEHQEVVHRNIEQPNRGTPITDNRAAAPDLSQHLNNYVLNVVNSYDYKGGNYPYLLNNDFENYNGVTEDIYYKNEIILKSHPSGKKYSHCTGITFEVFFKAMQNRNRANGIDINDFNGMTKDELFDLMLIWFVAAGPKAESNLAVGLEKYGLGQRITNLEDAAPGDFIDLSRENNTGHAVIFLDWIREGNKIIGLKHWSSQQSTKGISHKEEYFNIKDSNGQKYGNVILDSLYIGRVSPINMYK